MTTTTYSPKASEVERRWFVVDAKGKTLGRLSSQIAGILRGKHKPTYTPHMDMGDHVVVINASEVVVTGRKAEQKVYYHHTGYPGGIRSTPYSRMMETHPDRVVRKAIRGMMPHNTLGRQMLKKLRVYGGSEHRHAAQKPEALDL
ncbi:MAG: 50S ribosomal protein L13 [Candidatus Latescibacterota bacterium]|nr:50S ribosomal protein L13 [Candidatus Latescibacterota bacterium]